MIPIGVGIIGAVAFTAGVKMTTEFEETTCAQQS